MTRQRVTFVSFTLLFLTALLIYVNTASSNLAGTVFVSTSDGTPSPTHFSQAAPAGLQWRRVRT